jgi:hypothetical protein
LREILGLSRIGCHAQTQRVHPPFVLIVECLKRLGVALLGALNELGFVRVSTLSLNLFWIPVGQVAFSGRTP